MRKPTLSKTLRCTLSIGIALLLLAFAPAIATWGWHLTHPDTAEYAGYWFRVPSGFVLRRTSNGLDIIHGQTVFSTKLYRLAMITVEQTDQRRDLTRWEPTIAKETAQLRLNAPQTFRTVVGGTPLACYQENSHADWWVVVCMSADGMNINYVGDFDHIPELHAILEGARKL
jgi:hypothetical protein